MCPWQHNTMMCLSLLSLLLIEEGDKIVKCYLRNSGLSLGKLGTYSITVGLCVRLHTWNIHYWKVIGESMFFPQSAAALAIKFSSALLWRANVGIAVMELATLYYQQNLSLIKIARTHILNIEVTLAWDDFIYNLQLLTNRLKKKKFNT